MAPKKKTKNIKVKEEAVKVTPKVEEVEEPKVEEVKTEESKVEEETKVEEPIKVEAKSGGNMDALGKSFEALATAFKEGNATHTMQLALFSGIKRALNASPSDVPDELKSLASDFPEVVDGSSLRFDNDWKDNDMRAGYNALISMLMISEGSSKTEPYYMDQAALKGSLSVFGDNGHYLIKLYTEV